MIASARRLLADFSRCPSCAVVLQGNRCLDCGVDLSGSEARRVSELSVQVDRLLTERETVLRVLRTRAAAASRAPVAAGQQLPAGQQSSADTPSWSAPSGPLAPAFPAFPAPPMPPAMPPRVPTMPPMVTVPRSGLGVHGLLVGLGALLLSVAAIGFLVFSWRVLSLPGRAAVIAAATIGVLATASWLRGRLPETAEAVGGLGVVLVLADCWAIRRTGLFGADRPEGLGYAAAAAAGCALLLGGWALISRVRAGSWAAVTLAPLAVLLLAARLDGDLGPVPVFATGFLLIAGLALGRGLLPAGWQAERWLLRASAGIALIGAGGPAGFGLPGHARAALVLGAAALAAAAQAPADRSGVLLGRGRALTLRRTWSLAAGLLAGGAAVQTGLALASALGMDGMSVMIPLIALPALAVLAAAAVPAVPGAAIRRTAFGAGTALVAAVAALPVVVLAGWLPLRAAVLGAQAWTAQPGDRLGDLDPPSSATAWAVALIGLVVLGCCTQLAAGISGWPAWLRRPVRVVAAAAGGLAVIVLPLSPDAPVAAVVAALAVLSVGSVTLVTWPPAQAILGRSRSWSIAGWTTSALTGTLAVLLAWSCRDLSVPLTVLGAVALLLARRRVAVPVGHGTATIPGAALTGLAGLAGAAAGFAVAGGAGIAGVPTPLRVVWAGLAGGLSVVALIGLPRWVPAARPGRAGWTGADRLAAAAPGLLALVLGLLATLPDGPAPAVDGAIWPRPALLAVALVVGLTGAGWVRPTVALSLPILPLACAVAVAPMLGALAAAIRATVLSAHPTWAAGPAWPTLSLLWAVAAAVAAVVTAAVVLSGRADPARRVAAETGILMTGLIGLSLVHGLPTLWPALLVLGAGAAAIAATPDRHRIGWLAGVLLTGSTWARLAVGNVSLVEAYSVPPALALLALALYRFRRDRRTDPVRALLPVASVGLTPSIIVAATGPQTRPAVLIAVAAVLVLAGWLLQRRDHPGPGATLAGIGVLVAAATAGLRAGSTLWEASGPTGVPLSGIELWTLPAGWVVLLAALAVRPGAGRLPASPPVLAALLLAGVPTLLAAQVTLDQSGVDGRWSVPRAGAVLAVSALAGLAALADRIGPDRFRRAWTGLEPGALALAVAASWTGLRLDAGPVEVWTLPLAVLLLVPGWFRFRQLAAAGARPGGLAPSWAAYAPGVAVLLLPSLYLGLLTADGSVLREVGLITLAGATLVVGAVHRLQAPVLLGAGVLAVQTVALLLPWIAELPAAIPLWGWLAVLGLGLILLGASYEARMRQLRMVRLRLAALR